MKLPQAIQDQLDHAEALMNQAPAAPAGQADTPQEPETPAPQSPQEEQVPQAQAPQPAPQGPDWETKYRVLQGKYNAEVPALNQQVQSLTTAMQEMQAQMREAQKQRTEVEAKSLVTDADKEAFGADLVNLAERIAKQQMLPLQAELQRVTQVNEQLQSQLQRNTEEVLVTSQQGFLVGLSRAVPEWEQMNEDPGFLAWLQQQDPVFGVERQDALDRAAATLNVGAAAAVFNAYKAMSTPAPAKPKSAKDELQSQVAPSRSRAGVAPEVDVASTKIWSNQEIAEFYSNERKGFYTPEQAAKISQEIDRAASEGRVR